MASIPPIGSRRQDEPDFNLKEWALKARISRENSSSRRFSGSHIRSFREDARSIRSNVTVSSTASSPGYTKREEIDPSTYSFTTALKTLQAKTVYSWEYMSPDGFALNSKWNEAEKYICNPLSGEVPLECLSAKTLGARSFPNLTSRITMSAPLIYPSQSRKFQAMPPIITTHEDDVQIHIQEMPEKKICRSMSTRDIGTQSTPPDISSSSPSPAPTPSIEESPIKHRGNSPVSSEKLKYEVQSIISETDRAHGHEYYNEEAVEKGGIKRDHQKKKVKNMCSCKCSRQGGSGCLSWSLWMRRRQSEKHKPISKKNIFLYHVNGC